MGVARDHQLVDLVGHGGRCFRGNVLVDPLEVALGRLGARHQAVGHHRGGQEGEEREDGVEGDGCREPIEVVGLQLAVGPLQDVLPARPADVPGALGLPSAIGTGGDDICLVDVGLGGSHLR